MLTSFGFDVGFPLVLVNPDVITPSTNHCHVGTFNRVHTIVWTTRDFEFKFVGQRGAMNIISEVVNQGAVDFVFVRTRLLTSTGPNTRLCCSYTRARPTQVKTIIVDLVKKVLRVLSRCANKHDVAGLTMERHQPRTPLLPTVGELSKNVCTVMITRRRLHPERMKFLRVRKLLTNLRKTGNDPAAVTIDTDSAAFPVALACLIGMLQLTQQIVGNTVYTISLMVIPKFLDTGYKTGPRSRFELIQHRRRVLFTINHVLLSPNYSVDGTNLWKDCSG